jgi:hypothetical protein
LQANAVSPSIESTVPDMSDALQVPEPTKTAPDPKTSAEGTTAANAEEPAQHGAESSMSATASSDDPGAESGSEMTVSSDYPGPHPYVAPYASDSSATLASGDGAAADGEGQADKKSAADGCGRCCSASAVLLIATILLAAAVLLVAAQRNCSCHFGSNDGRHW